MTFVTSICQRLGVGKITSISKYFDRSDIGGRLVVVFLSNMSDDVESFKIAGHMEAECSSGKKKVLRTIAEPVTLEKGKKVTFLSLRGTDLLDERRQDPLIQRDGTLRLWCHLDIFRNYNVRAGPVEQPNPEDQVCKWKEFLK